MRDTAGTITSFDPGIDTFPASINNQGAIVGVYSGSTASSGFLRLPDGTITLLEAPACGPPSLHQSIATSINDAGVIRGAYKSCTFSAFIDRNKLRFWADVLRRILSTRIGDSLRGSRRILGSSQMIADEGPRGKIWAQEGGRHRGPAGPSL
jgi:hypothetical protein